MFNPRNYSDDMTLLHHHQAGEVNDMHQRTRHYGYAVHERDYAGVINRQSHDNRQVYQRNFGDAMHRPEYGLGDATRKSQLQGYRSNIPPRFHCANYNDADATTAARYHHRSDNTWASEAHHGQPSSRFGHENVFCPIGSARQAKTRRNAAMEDSLFPHGDPVPETYLGDWDQRPECPRPKWTYRQENPTWQPPIQCRAGDYSGTELIVARNEASLVTNCDGLTNFRKNVRPAFRRLASAMDPAFTLFSRNVILEDCGPSDCSDRSSVTSGSSIELSR